MTLTLDDPLATFRTQMTVTPERELGCDEDQLLYLADAADWAASVLACTFGPDPPAGFVRLAEDARGKSHDVRTYLDECRAHAAAQDLPEWRPRDGDSDNFYVRLLASAARRCLDAVPPSADQTGLYPRHDVVQYMADLYPRLSGLVAP
jgi:hypothetical protein